MASRATGKALIEFWQTPQVENRVSVRGAADLATACREVLGAQKDGLAVNLRTFSVDTALAAFERAHAERRPQTLAAYKSRFKKAVRWYLEYLDDPDGWPKGQPAPRQPEVDLFDYSFPLRAGVMLSLPLPTDLTAAEARRLAAFVQSLAIEQ